MAQLTGKGLLGSGRGVGVGWGGVVVVECLPLFSFCASDATTNNVFIAIESNPHDMLTLCHARASHYIIR